MHFRKQTKIRTFMQMCLRVQQKAINQIDMEIRRRPAPLTMNTHSKRISPTKTSMQTVEVRSGIFLNTLSWITTEQLVYFLLPNIFNVPSIMYVQNLYTSFLLLKNENLNKYDSTFWMTVSIWICVIHLLCSIKEF